MRSSSGLRRTWAILLPVLVAVYGALVVAGSTHAAWPAETGGVLAALVAGAALWWRQRVPVAVMATTLAGDAVVQLVAPMTLFPYAALFALFALAAARAPTISVPALAGVIGVTALAYPGNPSGDVNFAMAVATIPWALGEAVRNRRQAILEASRLAVSEEQGRIGRELHDVLAHSITVIVVQAAAADDVFDSHPEQARAALQAIERSARAALAELRTVLTAVRAEDGPWLDRLGELTGLLRTAGLAVEVHQHGTLAGLRPEVDLSAYRIVQEALTNTLRHGDASWAEVTIAVGADLLEVDVVDDGAGGSSSTGGGRGIPGMRERAAALGGTLEAGCQPSGGFRLRASLPLRPAR